MTVKREIYKCSVCGNIVEVLHAGAGQLVCCGQPMQLMKENADDSAVKEKHIPIISGVTGKKVKIGAKKHPMEEKHYIEWIELFTDGKIRRKFLKPGDKPEAEFCVCEVKELSAQIYCNVHGLWKSK
jgi:superoxide reductase